jgi:CheY-like chemotaxis protein
MPHAKPILLVEDDPIDALAIKRALADSNIAEAMIHVPCVREALSFLRSAGTARPALILLDLNLPETDGLEFLGILKNDPSFSDIPVVVLTGSDEPRDIVRSFDLGIAGYMVKSPHYEGLRDTIRTIQDYWNLSRSPAHLADRLG